MSKPIYITVAVALTFGWAMECGAAESPAKFLGANSCSSSSCHGGGGANQNQYLVWSLKDFHAQRPAATLTTARSRQIADALGINNPTTDTRCTSCHAPLDSVPKNLRDTGFKVSEGVSCESCHGPAEHWLRSHTRTDYTRADRTASGMRDLQNLYVRANTCVACHQVVAEPLLQAGHPELMFELDGQSVAEPKHWSTAKNGNSAQAWFVGQAVALREMSWELAKEPSPTENEINRWRGLVWLMVRAGKMDAGLPAPPDITFRPNTENFKRVQKWSDSLARAASQLAWTEKLSRAALTALVNTAADFDEAVPQPVQARRASRLVLALDRLLAAQHIHRADADLNRLFQLAQSIPDFDPAEFSAVLKQCSAVVSGS